jgi:hypothetical protein
MRAHLTNLDKRNPAVSPPDAAFLREILGALVFLTVTSGMVLLVLF